MSSCSRGKTDSTSPPQSFDPSADPKSLWTNFDHGISTKTIFDCTVPWSPRDRLIRAPFQDVDVTRFLPDWTGD